MSPGLFETGLIAACLFGAGFAVLLLIAAASLLSVGCAALAASQPARLLRLEKDGHGQARTVMHLHDAGEAALAPLRLGALLALVLACVVAVGAGAMAGGIGGIVGTGLALVLVAGSGCGLLPPLVAQRHPERAALRLAPFLASALRVFEPIWSAAASPLRLSKKPKAADEDPDRDILDGVLDLGDLTVGDVMIHRTEMTTVNADEPADTIVAAVMQTEYSRVPLWRGSPENIVGILHSKDLLRAIQNAQGQTAAIDVSRLIRPPWFVPNIRPLSEQLRAFRRRHTHFALVVDEYGEVEGLVTLEDILEEIVGDIADEHDVAVPGVQPQPDGSVVVEGTVPIRDLNRTMDWDLPDDQATTVAGLVIHEARSIPNAGQAFTFHGLRFRVLRKERNRIAALRITTLGQPLALPPPAATTDDRPR